MSSYERRHQDAPDDPLDEVIRGSLQTRATRSAPPGDGWSHLRSQVRAGPARRRRMAGVRFQHLLNGIVQGAAAMIVIAMLGASLTPGRATDKPLQPTPTVVEVYDDEQQPSQPLFVPADMPQRKIVHNSPPSAPVYLPTRGDTLSMADLIETRSPGNNNFNPALLLVSNPRLDPTLSYYSQ